MTTSSEYISRKSSDRISNSSNDNGSTFFRTTDEEIISESNIDENHKYMSVCWSGNLVGISYFNIDTLELYMMPDMAELKNSNIFKKAYLQIEPKLVVISTRNYYRLKEILFAIDESNNDENLEKKIGVLPSIDFALSTCKSRLALMKLPNFPVDLYETEKNIYLSSLIQMDNTNMVRCIGALLKYLEKNRIGIELESTITRIPILSLRTLKLTDMLLMDDNCFSNLQIFKEQIHPSGLMFSRTREGISLFNLMDKCKSKVGSLVLRNWFKHPLANLEMIKERQDAVEFFVHVSNMEVFQMFEDNIKKIKNITPILKRMAKLEGKTSDWGKLYKTICAILSIGNLVNRPECIELDILKEARRILCDNRLLRIANLLASFVDFEETLLNDKFCLKPMIDPNLDTKKKMLHNTKLLENAKLEELKSLDSNFKNCLVTYHNKCGFLFQIEKPEYMKQSNDYFLPEKTFVFENNDIMYYKTIITRKLDADYGELYYDIREIEYGHMHEIQNNILSISTLLLDAVHIIGDIDCLMTYANSARFNNYVRPLMINDNVIEIKKGRHPIFESMSNDMFVSNDTKSGLKRNVNEENFSNKASESETLSSHKIQIITGANSSGKSVYLKQVGLIVYMAQIGSFVPAESATLGVIDQMFTSIQNKESISLSMSSFYMDINRVSLSTHHATDRSLVLLDEFGLGSIEEDGAALLVSVIKYFIDQYPQMCPHLFISTHFYIIVEARLLPRSPIIKFQTMLSIMSSAENELTFLYQLKDGMTCCSHANEIARKMGLPTVIIDRAKMILYCTNEGKVLTRQIVGNIENQDDNFKRSASILKKFFSLELEKNNLNEFLQNINHSI